MNNELRSQFTDMKRAHTVRPDFRASLEATLQAAPVIAPAKEAFPAQIKTVIDRSFQMFVPKQFAPAVQGFTSLVLIMAVAASGWIGAVSASYNTVPGDALYNVKLATEKVQIAAVEVRGNKSKTAKLHTEFAERRAAEVKKVIDTNKEPEQARTAMALLAESVQSASDAVKEAQADPDVSEAAVDSTEALLADTERIAASLLAVLKTLPPNVSDLIDEIVVIHGDLTDSRLSTLQEIVRQQLDGRSNLSQDETRAVVVDALKQISDQNEEVATLVQQIEEQATLEDLEAEMLTTSNNDVTSSSTVSTTVDTVSTTSTTDTSSSTLAIEDLQNTDEVTLEDVDDATNSVDEDIAEATALVEEGDLFEAIEKAKSANSKQTEIQKVVQKAAAAAGLNTIGSDNTVESTDDVQDTETTVATSTADVSRTPSTTPIVIINTSSTTSSIDVPTTTYPVATSTSS